MTAWTLKALTAAAVLFAATPAMAEKIYAANALSGEATISVDGDPHVLAGGYVQQWRQAPGRYTVQITTADGRTVSGTGDFSAGNAAETRGDRYWCVIVGESKTGELRLLTPDANWCKGFIDKGN